MQGLSFFLLKAGFEGEIVQRSKIYTLDSLLLTLVFFCRLSRYEGLRGFYKGLVPYVLR